MRRKIFLDGRVGTGGLGKYVSELAGGLRDRGYEVVVWKGGRGHWIWQEQVELAIKLLKERPDIYHASQNWGIPLFCFSTVVLTIHDVIPECLNGYFIKSRFPALSKFLYHLRIQLGVWRAKRIICVSEATKRDLQEHFNVKAKKLVVIYDGVNKFEKQRHCESILASWGLVSGRYILNHGGIEKRKNLTRLIIAFRDTSIKDTKTKLVITGDGTEKKRLEDLVRNLGMDESVVFTGWVDESSVGVLVKNAKFLVYPTLAEGFGLPLLESMAAGVTAVASNIAALREIGKEVPIYIDPKSVSSITKGMERAVSEKVKKKWSAKYFMERYSWKRTVDETVKVYRDQ